MDIQLKNLSITTVIVITLALMVLLLIIFPIKSTEISCGFTVGYRCSCLGIDMPVTNDCPEISSYCYGAPYGCVGEGFNADNLMKKFILHLLIIFLPAFIFLFFRLNKDYKSKIIFYKALLVIASVVVFLIIIAWLAGRL